MKQKVVWMSWINWFVHCCKRASSRWTVAFFELLSEHVGHCWIQCICSVHYIWSKLTARQATPAAGDYFCTSWQHNYSMVTRLHVSGHRNFWRFWRLQNVGVHRNEHVDQESSLQRMACLHHWVVWLTATLRIDVDDAACAREEKTGRRQNATHVEYRSASSTAVWWRRVGHEPRVETNARVISQWAGAECDYCRGSEYCSDAVTWNTTINVSQIKSIFAAIAVFILYITYIFQYTRQRSFLRYRNTYVTCNTGSYIDVLIWVIFDPMHKRLNYSRCIYGPLIAHNYGKCWPIFKFFLHPRTQQRSCNELIIKGQSLDPSHLKGIRYSTLWNVHVTKLLTIWNKCLV